MTLLIAQTWHLLGWTMLHFLWLGTTLLIVSAVIRRALRHAGPNVRYAHSLATLFALAALPLATAIWIDPLPPPATASNSAGGFPPPSPPGEGEGTISAAATGSASDLFSAVRGSPDPALVTTEGLPTTPPQFIELNPNYTPPAEPGDFPLPLRGEGLREGVTPLGATGSASAPSMLEQDTGIASGTLLPALAFIERIVPYLPYLWLLGTPITFALLATGLIGAERMRRHGTPLAAGPAHEACERLRRSLRITRRVALAVCDRVAQPVLVGIVRPLILLPPVALTGWSPDELEMVLLHELAHVRRWDNLINLAQRVIESLLFFQPAVWIASTWVRRDREECCDAVVVTRTREPKQYAELLVSLATPQPLAGLAFASHPLAARLRRILKLEDEPMLVSRNTIGLLALAVVAIALVVVSGPMQVLGDPQPSVEESALPTDTPSSDTPSPTDTVVVESSDPALATTEGLQTVLPPSDGTQFPPGSAVIVADPPPQPAADGLGERKAMVEAPPHNVFGIEAPAKLSDEDAKRIVKELKDSQEVEAWFCPGIKGNRALFVRLNQPTTGVRIVWETNSDGERTARVIFAEPGRTDPQYVDPRQPGESIAVAIPPAEPEATPPPQLPFLSLEDQKIADRAYKLLGVELEPLTQEELARVAKLGFQGGLRVSFVENSERKQWMNLVQNDLLVGLHVWPITSFESLDAVLKRPDLAQLSPLKFYVVRNVGDGHGGPTKNTVVTGRLAIDSDQLRLLQNSSPAPSATIYPGPPLAVYTNPTRPQPTYAAPQPAQPSTTANSYGPATVLGPRVDRPSETAPPAVSIAPQPVLISPPSGQPSDPEPLKVRSGAALPWTPPTEAPQSAPAQAQPERRPHPSDWPTPTVAPTWNAPTTSPQPTPAQAPDWPRVPTEPKVYPQQPTPTAPSVVPPQSSVGDGLTLMVPAPPIERPPNSEGTLTYTPAEAPVLDPATGEPEPRSVLEPSPAPLNPTPTPTTPNQQSEIRNPQSEIPNSSTPVYRYDGKTFQTWRDTWKHELSTEKRIEAVKALAAFARTGQAKDAAEAILEVAAEAKFSRPVPHNSEDHSLRTAIIGTLTAEWPIDPAIVFPMIMERFETAPDQWRNFLASYLRSLKEAEPAVAQQIATLAKHDAPELRAAALDALFHIDQSEFQDRVAEALNDSDSEVVINAMQKLSLVASRSERSGDQQSEAEEISFPDDKLTALLYHDGPKIKSAALQLLRRTAPQHGENIAARLIEVLNDEARRDDRLVTIRFLGVIGKPASAAASHLLQIIKDSDDTKLRVAAAVALDQIEHNARGRALQLDGIFGDEQAELIEQMNEEHRAIHGLPSPRR